MIKSFFDAIMDFAYGFVVAAIALLPNSPFANIDFDQDFGGFTQVMGWINYFVPIGTMLAIGTVYTTAVLIWYGARWILRFARYID